MAPRNASAMPEAALWVGEFGLVQRTWFPLVRTRWPMLLTDSLRLLLLPGAALPSVLDAQQTRPSSA